MTLTQDRTTRTVTWLVLALAAFSALFPIVLTLLNSLKTNAQITTNPLAIPSTLQFGNYLAVWRSADMGRALLNSALIAGTTILLTCSTAAMAAYVLARKAVRGWQIVSVYFLGTTTLPVQLFLFPLYFIFARVGLVNNPFGVALIYTAIYTPFSIFLLRTYFLAIPLELEEAARVEGANDWQVFTRIVLPMITPGLITVALVVGLYAWNEFLVAVTFLQSRAVETAVVRFYNMTGQFSSDWGALMAAAVILALPVVVFFLALQRRFIEGMASGSVKG